MLIRPCLLLLVLFFSPLNLFSEGAIGGHEITETQRAFLEEGPDETTTTPSENMPSMTLLLVKTVTLLAVLCGAAVAGTYLLRRLGGNQFNSFSSDGTIRLVERKYLSPKTSVWLIEVQNRSFLIVETQHQASIQSVETTPNTIKDQV